jgi:hypothetical protein
MSDRRRMLLCDAEHIANLRRKIEPADGERLIHTSALSKCIAITIAWL